MFQPQPTPYAQFIPYGFHIANAGIPDYTFAPTPLLGQFGGGHVGGNTGGNGGIAGVGGVSVRRGGPSPNNFHSSAGVGGSAPAPGLGTPTTAPATVTSDNSPGYSSSGTHNNGHSRLYNIPMPVPPHHHSQLQHQQPRLPNQTPQHRHRHLQSQPQQHSHIHGRTTLRHDMDQQSELDQQEAAAGEFKPRLEGPLVGEKVPSQAITEEYARADPTYVAKTMALPQTYTHYRPILGDGNCGWRAIAFAYFETLVQCGDVNFVQSELERMTTLNKGIEDVGGQDPSIFEFMVSETLDLYNDIIRAMSTGNDAMPILMLKFNDAATSACFVYHLRLLACARLRGNSTQYEPYLGANVGAYINSTIMPVDREIDHICVVLLHDILLEPASIVLDIAYLDRSEGDEVNVHRLPEEANGRDPSTLGPIIYLLYRPGHYDILYRNNQIHVQPVVAMPAPLNVRINRATSFVQHNHDFENPVPALQDTYGLDMTAIAMLPSATPSSLSQFGPPSTTPSPMTDPYTQSSASSWAQQFTPESISAPTPSHPSPPQQQPTVHQLRFSKYNVAIPGMAAENNNTHEPAFTTNTFKNSHYNVAHYNNQNFQPEMYQPDAEEEAPNSGHGKIGGRKRSSEHCLGIKKEK